MMKMMFCLWFVVQELCHRITAESFTYKYQETREEESDPHTRYHGDILKWEEVEVCAFNLRYSSSNFKPYSLTIMTS